MRIAGGASWVHLDEADSAALGHLLILPAAGGGALLYDIRSVSATHSHEALEAASAVATLPAPPGAACGCFAAEGAALVVGGARSAEALRYSGEPAVVPDEDDDDEVRSTKPVKAKPARQPKAPQKRMFNRTK